MNFKKLVLNVATVAGLLMGSAIVFDRLPSAHAQQFHRQCIGEICIGSQVEIVWGAYSGERGTVVGIDQFNGYLSVISQSRGEYLYPEYNDLRIVHNGAQNCVENICVNHQARVLSGIYHGHIGTVVGVDSWSYSATLLVRNGQYLSVSIRDLQILGNRPIPIPQPPRRPLCPIGTVYDHFRNVCVSIGPRPIPRPLPPRPFPRPLPPRPFPPRPFPPGIPGPIGPRPIPGPGPVFPGPIGPGLPGMPGGHPGPGHGPRGPR